MVTVLGLAVRGEVAKNEDRGLIRSRQKRAHEKLKMVPPFGLTEVMSENQMNRGISVGRTQGHLSQIRG